MAFENRILSDLWLRLIEIRQRMYSSRYSISLDDIALLQTSLISHIQANENTLSDQDKNFIEHIKMLLEHIYQFFLAKENFSKKRDRIFRQFENNITCILYNSLLSVGEPMIKVKDYPKYIPNIINTLPAPLASKISKRSNYPKNITYLLKHWLKNNLNHPYPDEEQKLKLSQETGLCLTQINNWFINARRRILPDLAEKQHSR